MVLFFSNGEHFATGAIRYAYRPPTASETTNRMILQVEVSGREIEAIIDTGAPYAIIAPRIARLTG